MAAIRVPAYGSLYFNDAPIDPQHKIIFGDFCVRPHVSPNYWDCNVDEIRYYNHRKSNKGPWLNMQEYCSCLFDASFSRIPPVEDAPKNELPSVQEHQRLLKFCEEVIGELIKCPLLQPESLAIPMLFQISLHKRNIFVSEDGSYANNCIDRLAISDGSSSVQSSSV
ncbi:hypothetical protein M422DRAFT_263043 [Sphaerobolus stellatus SS14]|uniref:Uncharacterized protein n=1 Tax=Sphaerobolus stellatus (strain SS14) TaxID=990650 RepID=A0A0C9UJ16_SPHS4|nr:hypothetical protein M422DRAFT_263043 [Sphaerobolus stellatus SS14]